ncbi:MAG: ATP-binding protein [Candidatus Melainabacteria bacterium]|nr:ATP-binding protein [Candidatus Melainabacteria bacterium]
MALSPLWQLRREFEAKWFSSVKNSSAPPKPTDMNKKPAAAKALKSQSGWQDICFVHAIVEDEEQKGEGVVVLNDGSMRKFISLTGCNLLLSDEDEKELLARQFANFVDSCDSDIQIIVKSRHLAVDEYLSKYQMHVKTQDEYLKRFAEYTDKWFRSIQDISFIPQREFYIVISFQPPDCASGANWKGVRSKEKHDDYVYVLNRMARNACEQLRQSNLKPKILTLPQVRNLIYSDLNPSLSAREPEAPPADPGISEASCLTRSALEVQDRHLWLDGKLISTHYVSKLPHDTWIGWLVDLMMVGAEYTFSIFIHQCNQEKVRSELKRKYQLSKMANSQCNMPDLEAFELTAQTEAAIQEFLRSSSKAYDVSMYVSCAADSVEQSNRYMDEIDRVLKNRGATIEQGEFVQLDGWQSTLAVGVDKLAISNRVMSPIVGTLWPFFTASCGTPDGVPFGFALSSREPVLLNPFFHGAGKDANNMFVVGTTGAGKSFAVSMLILRLLPTGVRFVLIDKTVDKFGSYRFITELLGPSHCSYIDLGPSSGFILNPFDLGPDDYDKNGGPTSEKISNLLSLLDLMLAPEGREELRMEDKSILDKLIRLTYAISLTEKGRVPTMTDLANVIEQTADIEPDNQQRAILKMLSRSLSLFTKTGAFGGLVDGYTNVDTTKPFIVFDTRDVNEPRLERIAVYMLAEFIRRTASECKKNDVRLAAIIDEASTLMRFPAGARLLDDLSRRSRHYGMMLVSITQQLKDFFQQSKQADSVVKNAHMKILLRQDASDLALLKEALRLKDAEVAAIEQFARDDERRKESHALLIVGAKRGTVRLVPSPQDYWVCTSEPIKDVPRRREMIEAIKEKQPEMSHAEACRQAVYFLGLQHGGG